MAEFYISITGLILKSRFSTPLFWWHAIRSMQQAREAEGNLHADARTINGVHHTISAWRVEADMRRYLVSGAHLQAMKRFPRIATGKTLGFVAASVPEWDEVHRLWLENGKEVG